jgi:hypothetical protein
MNNYYGKIIPHFNHLPGGRQYFSTQSGNFSFLEYSLAEKNIPRKQSHKLSGKADLKAYLKAYLFGIFGEIPIGDTVLQEDIGKIFPISGFKPFIPLVLAGRTRIHRDMDSQDRFLPVSTRFNP